MYFKIIFERYDIWYGMISNIPGDQSDFDLTLWRFCAYINRERAYDILILLTFLLMLTLIQISTNWFNLFFIWMMNKKMRSCQCTFSFLLPKSFVCSHITFKQIELESPTTSQMRDIFKGLPMVVYFLMSQCSQG